MQCGEYQRKNHWNCGGVKHQTLANITFQESGDASLQPATRAIKPHKILARTGKKIIFYVQQHLHNFFCKDNTIFDKTIIGKTKPSLFYVKKML
jgi:hypothetical protein